MPDSAYSSDAPTRAEIDRWAGPAVLEFGTAWCGHCQAAAPLVRAAFAGAADGIVHRRIEDGKGRPLGRSFAVKLWPTLIFLRDGREVARLVRPTEHGAISAALAALSAA